MSDNTYTKDNAFPICCSCPENVIITVTADNDMFNKCRSMPFAAPERITSSDFRRSDCPLTREGSTAVAETEPDSRQRIVHVLGTEYRILIRSKSEDKNLENCDGYCDKTSRTIVIGAKEDDCELDDFDMYQKKVKRHELIHAFLFESGLHESWKHSEWGHDETYVDWIANQFGKLLTAFVEADAL